MLTGWVRIARRALLAVGCCLLAIAGLPGGSAGAATIDGLFAAGGRIESNSTLTLTVTGRGGVPASGVGAVALNVTVTAPTILTYLTVWPTGQARPLASNLNAVAGQTVPNMVIAKVGVNGQVSIYNAAGTAHVVVDVLGWFPTESTFNSLNPARLLDTRVGSATIDGQFAAGGRLGRGETLELTVAGRGAIPGSGLSAVAVNVTATSATDPSYLTVWPTGQPLPLASNLNLVPDRTVPNLVIARVGVDGKISILNAAGSTHVVVDVLGWFPASGTYKSLTPARLLDTRPASPTVDGQFSGTGALGARQTLDVTVTGRGGVPTTNVQSVVVNVTATRPFADTFLTLWPTGSERPNASNLNVPTAQTIANLAIVQVGANGRISLYSEAGSTEAVIDVLGWFPLNGTYQSLVPARLMDTRSEYASNPAACSDGELRRFFGPQAYVIEGLCLQGWAYIGTCTGECGDHRRVVEIEEEGWRSFTAFPSAYCRNQVLAAGAPAVIVDRINWRC